MKIIKVADQRFRDGVKSRFCFLFLAFSEFVLRMQHCFFSHFSIHSFFRRRYSLFNLRSCLRTLIRSWMPCNITWRIMISRRSKIVNSRHRSHMDAPMKQTPIRATSRNLFAAFQIRFFRSVHDENRYGLFGIVDSSDGAKFSTFRRSKSRGLEEYLL